MPEVAAGQRKMVELAVQGELVVEAQEADLLLEPMGLIILEVAEEQVVIRLLVPLMQVTVVLEWLFYNGAQYLALLHHQLNTC